MESIAAEAAIPVHRDSARRRRVLFPVLAAALACAVAAAIALSVERRARPGDAVVLRDAVSEHRASALASGAPLDITAASAARLERWIKGRLGLAVTLPSSGARGEALVGARVATVDGRAAAHIVYDGGGRRVSLFVTGRPPRRLPEESEHNVYGVDVYTTTLEATALGWWEDGRHLYLTVMAANREDDGDVLAMAARCVQSRATETETPRLRRHWLVAPARARPAIAHHAPDVAVDNHPK
jgi:anti-sigma factor RsiW